LFEKELAMQDAITTRIRSGSCLCGGVTFRVSGDPLRVGICHCTDCRKSSGAPFAAFAVWPIEAFEQRTGHTSTYANRSFCTTCGGRVAWLSDGEAEVTIGSLDEVPTGLRPEYELWVIRREHWLDALPSASQYEQDRVAEAAPPEP
jgi:hypothetical protein